MAGSFSIGEWLMHPPGWAIAILLGLLVGHLLKLLLDFLRHAKDNTIDAIEITVTFGILAAGIHQAYENSMKMATRIEWFDQPMTYLAALIFFAILSVIVLLIQKRFSP